MLWSRKRDNLDRFWTTVWCREEPQLWLLKNYLWVMTLPFWWGAVYQSFSSLDSYSFHNTYSEVHIGLSYSHRVFYCRMYLKVSIICECDVSKLILKVFSWFCQVNQTLYCIVYIWVQRAQWSKITKNVAFWTTFHILKWSDRGPKGRGRL